MQKIFQEYGGVIMTVLAIVGIIGCIAIMFTPYGTGWMDDAFKRVIGTFSTKATEATPDLNDYEYYSSFGLAIADVNAGTIGENADVDKPDAVCGVYTTSDGDTCVVFFKDGTETATTTISADVTIKLDGHKLSYSGVTYGIDTVANNGNTITIDGRRKGSGISITNPSANALGAIRVQAGNEANINYGTYTSESTSKNAMAINFAKNSTSSVSNSTIVAKSGSGEARGVQIAANAAATLTNCNIQGLSSGNMSTGVYTSAGSTTTLTNCTVSGVFSDDATEWTRGMWESKGIFNYGSMTLNDCNVTGIFAGVCNLGNLYVYGGVYQSPTHGGFYFVGTGDEENYINNATLRCTPQTGDETVNDWKTAFYIGSSGSTVGNNFKVYMNNCVLDAEEYICALRDTGGEHDNTLYISNCRAVDGKALRIDNTTHKVYIGQGCNFTAEDATLPEAVVKTDEVYTKN